MIRTLRRDLNGFVVELVAEMERFGGIVPDDDTIVLRSHTDGSIRLDLTATLPWGPTANAPLIRLREIWRPDATDTVELAQYAYQLRHPPLDYRRALHQHQAAAFLRSYGRSEHEHCEAPIGTPLCAHVAGEPVRGAIDGFRRLLDLFVTGEPPDCQALRCLEG